MEINKSLTEIIKETLGARKPKGMDREKYYHAGVLIPLFRENGKYKILFTKRTDMVEHHKGQISFPGGGVEKDDRSVMETALRETQEEIGLMKEEVEILGRTDDILTLVSNFVITPFVGLIPFPYDFERVHALRGPDGVGFSTSLTGPQLFDFYAAWLGEDGWQLAPADETLTRPHQVWLKEDAELRFEIHGFDEQGRSIFWMEIQIPNSEEK